jgi:hypothetical protein
MNEAWVLMKCSQSLVTMMAHFELSCGCWYLAEVAPTATARASSPGVLPMVGRFDVGPGYSGCLSCHSSSYVCCHVCGEISCWNSANPLFKCGFCQNSGPVTAGIESIRPNDWA